MVDEDIEIGEKALAKTTSLKDKLVSCLSVQLRFA